MNMHAKMAEILKNASLLASKCYVGGQWTAARSGQTFSIQDPASLNEIAKCPDFGEEDTVSAIEAAASAFSSFRQSRARDRAKLLRRWYELMLENVDDLSTIISLENGKPLSDSRGEVTYAASFLEWFSEEAPRVYGDTIIATNPDCRIMTRKEPVGVCALIAPWNFPAAMITRKVGPALAVGCTVVVKAPPEAPLTALALAKLAEQAGVPPGVVNVITTSTYTAKVGKVMTTHPIVKKVSFTGSTNVGKLLMSQSSSTLKKLSFELGGNAPFVVFDDADLNEALTGLLASKFRLSGQTCVCANRILVERGVYDKFISMVHEAVDKFVLGSAFDPKTTHGPLIHERAVEKVDFHVRDALAKGARLIRGGKKLDSLGPNFYDITLLADITPDMQLCREETFGPLAAFIPFDTEEQALELANSSEVGLAGYFYSKDAARCWRFGESLEVGMVGVNVGIISDAAAPFGGIKESGFGREGSKYGTAEFVNIKMTMIGVGSSGS